ncbi:hypothetical protein GCM10010515_05500 [Streptomyces fructofermentans]|uniref:Uncharacterized protein n=1 Tax=Streptomyces fructofermentans TaxID=152141 RepID=A0A918N5F3_9ACTN|nr:hypothetical protein GCM10010515_05500 [Streptomyces fructofermentans]
MWITALLRRPVGPAEWRAGPAWIVVPWWAVAVPVRYGPGDPFTLFGRASRGARARPRDREAAARGSGYSASSSSSRAVASPVRR